MADVGLLRCMTNRVLTVMGEPEVIPVGEADDKLVIAARKAAVFIDGYPALQPAKRFTQPWALVHAFIKNPNANTLITAEPALNVLFHVVGELEGVLNECGGFDVVIEGVFPPSAPVGTDLQPRSGAPEPPASGASPNPGPSIASPTGNTTKIVAFSVAAVVTGAVLGFWWRGRKKARRPVSQSRRAQD
jgi:hypothetical protein